MKERVYSAFEFVWLYHSLTYENVIFQQFMYLENKCTKTGMIDDGFKNRANPQSAI